MNLKTIFFSAISAGLLLASCGGPGEGRSISDIKNASASDSISNLLGQYYASDYWKAMSSDSARITRESRDEYLKGVAEALKLAGKDDAYIEGYMLGLNLLQYTGQYTKEMGMELSTKEILNGLAYGLRSDSAVNLEQVNADLSRITTRFAAEKDAKDKVAGQKKVAEYAKKHGLQKFTAELYGKIEKQGSGKKLADGDNIKCSISASDSKGNKIRVPLPSELEVSQQLNNTPIGAAILQLTPGGAGDFVASAFDVFGTNCARFNVDPSDIVILKVGVDKLLDKNAAAPASTTPQQEEEGTLQPADARQ